MILFVFTNTINVYASSLSLDTLAISYSAISILIESLAIVSFHKNMLISISFSLSCYSLLHSRSFSLSLSLSLSDSLHFLSSFAYINLQNVCSEILSLVAAVQIVSCWHLLFKYRVSYFLFFSFFFFLVIKRKHICLSRLITRTSSRLLIS